MRMPIHSNLPAQLTVSLEVLQAPLYTDVSVAQWLGLTPNQVVKDHLGFSDDTLNRLPKFKPYILPGNANLTTTNFTVAAHLCGYNVGGMI